MSKRVLVAPAATQTVQRPAEYKTIKKRVMVRPAQTQNVERPARYETIRVRKVVSPPQERRVPVPAEYQTVTKRIAVSEGLMEWRPILCETNTTKDVVSKIQRALANRGYDPGPVDGVLGSKTMTAVESFQRASSMAEGQLTMETLRQLGVVQSI